MNHKINLVAQSFGRKNEYLRTIFSIWSFYVHVSAEFKKSKTLLFTDNPDFFRAYLSELPVTYELLTPERMTEMRGENDFLHRIKIAVIAEAFKRSEGNLLYMDGDAFFTEDPSPLILRLTKEVSFMHTNEYPFHVLREIPLPSGAPFHAVLNYFEENVFTMANGNKRKFSPTLFSWNAGVVMLHRQHEYLLTDVFAITDQLYASTRNHASEQYAFSIVLQTQTELKACEKVSYHYWHKVKKQIGDHFLNHNISFPWLNLPVEQKKDLVSKWTRKLPGYFDRHLLTVRDNAIQAFNRNDFRQGYFWAFNALIRNPFNIKFIRDFAYHTRRFLFKRRFFGRL
ncbi:MAG: hypothetical protein WD824_06405 [Cyclobacteriaceae bacterium]